MKASLIVVLCIASCALGATIFQRPVHPVFAGKEWNPSRIVGGQEASPHSIPYQAALFLGGSFCGASLISAKWVLTAAHCGEITSSPQVVLGAHRVQDSESTQQVINGRKPIVHPNWDSQNLRNDISLIELPQAATLNSNVQPVTLVSANAGDFAGSSATASGWGKPSDSATSISPVLRVVSSNILTNSECNSIFGIIQSSHVCLDGSQGKSTCSGDSGGPLTVGGQQIGLTSFGAAAGCEKGYPAAFTRISSFRSWIEQTSGV